MMMNGGQQGNLVNDEVEDRAVAQDHPRIPQDLVRDAAAVAWGPLTLRIIILTRPAAPGALRASPAGLLAAAASIPIGCKEALQLCDVGL